MTDKFWLIWNNELGIVGSANDRAEAWLCASRLAKKHGLYKMHIMESIATAIATDVVIQEHAK